MEKAKKQQEELKKGEFVIYKTFDKKVDVRVNLNNETVWLTQAQIALLFDTERSVITKHLQNVFKEGELQEKSNVQKMHIANSDKLVNFYNLDIVISVGYRVNSMRATDFRIWATKTLKDYLVQGYAVNEKRLLAEREKFKELQGAINLLQEKLKNEWLIGQEQEILSLLSNYSKSLLILEQYDNNNLKAVKGEKAKFTLKYSDAVKIIANLKKELSKKEEAGNLFGLEYKGKFEGIISVLYQTFDKRELYLGINEKAAYLFYLIIKDHPFADGNKRIASFLFVYFLDKNNYLYKNTGEKKINDNALVALALLIAISDPKDKEIMIKIIINLLNG